MMSALEKKIDRERESVSALSEAMIFSKVGQSRPQWKVVIWADLKDETE